MAKKFTYLLFCIATIGSFILQTPSAHGQCSTTSWTLTPPPVNGAYDAGQTVTACLTISHYQVSGANWLHGVELNFPPAWDASTVTNISVPDACGSANGVWMWAESVTGTGNGGTYGPGFFYDANSGGPQDGNPGNNYGDYCSNFTNFTFCFDITLDAACGGGGNPYDGNDILPVIHLLGDGESGSWGGSTACESTPTSPNIPGGITLNCCDAESGVPPAEPLNICGTTAFDLMDTLSGPIDTPGLWSGPAGWAYDGSTTTAIFDPNIDGPGDYSYSVVGSDGCINTSTITIENIELGPQAVTGYCESDPVHFLDIWNNPNFTPNGGGTWYDPNGTVILDDTLRSNFPSGPYLYEYDDVNGCYTTVIFNITVSPGGAGGLNSGDLTLCVLDGCFSPRDTLQAANGGVDPLTGGQWIYSALDGTQLNAYMDDDPIICPDDYNGAGTNMVDGYLVYFSINLPCPLQYDTLYVDAYEPFNSGENTDTTICASTPPMDLTDLLDGSPDAGGTWYDPDNNMAVVPQPFDPSSVAPDQAYNFIYEGGLEGTACYASILLTVTILSDQTDAGDPGTAAVCVTESNFQMLDSLGGTPQPGGVWVNAVGDTIPGGFYIPAIHSPGVYTYLLNSQCGSDSETLTVTELTVPDPGTNGVLDICSDDVNVQLITGLGGTPDGPGNWLLAGTPVGPTVDGNSVNDGDIYTYVVGSPGCQASAQVEINLTSAPFAGTAAPGPHEFCDSDAPIDLFSLLATPPSVSVPNFWTGPSGFTGSVFDPASDPSGTYTYSIPDNGCGGDSESIIISVETTPNAGTTTNALLCPTATGPISLDSILSYPAPLGAGSWTSVPPGGPTNGVFTPGVDPEGVYTYTAVSTPNGLCSATASVSIGYVSLPYAGIDTVITVCENDPPFQMTTGDNPDPGGNWSNGTGQFVPGTTSPGTFTYSFPGGSCPNPSATVTVNVTPQPDAGNNTSENVCVTAGIIDLPSFLSGNPDPNGIWNNLTSGATDVADQFDVSGSAGTSVTFEYVVENGNCSDAATLNINVHAEPDAGPDVSATLCGTGGMYSLTNILDPAAEPGTFHDSNGPVPGNMIPLLASASGTYTYEVTGTFCPTDVATYTVTIQEPLNVSNVTTACNAAQTDYTVSFEITGGDGNYTVTGLTGTLNTSVSPATFTSDLLPSGTSYSYTVSDGGPCADVVVNNQPGPICDCPADAAWVGGNVAICEGESVDLELDLTGTGPFYIDYTDGTSPTTNAGPFADGDVISVSPNQNTTYTLTQVSDANCFTGVNSSVTISVEPLPNAGPDVTTEFCAGGTLNLNTLIDAGADTPGLFTGPVTVTNNTVPQMAASSGVYTYTVSGTQCPDDQASYDITIFAPLDVSPADVVCNPSQTAYTVSFEINGGDGNYNITEASGYGGTLSGSNPAVFTSDEIPNGSDYEFTISDGSPCNDVVVQGVEPQCDCPATADLTGTTSICLSECTDLVFDLTGDGPFTVVYENSTDPANPITLTGINDQHVITVCPNATTTYTVTSVSDANCDGFSTGTPVTVTVDQPLSVSSPVETCDANNENYTVTFTVTGGDPGTYVVTSNVSGIGNGSVVNGDFTSPPIPTGTAYDFTVSDNGACDPVEVTGTHTCQCTTDAGTLQGGSIEVCQNENAVVTHNGDETLDGNDGFQFLLHDGDAGSIGSVLATSSTGSFSFGAPIQLGTTYYITAVAGNTDGFGDVELSHPCTDQTQGVPVVFNGLPSATISGGAMVCEGVPVDLTVTFTGEAPFSFNYSIDGADQGNFVSATNTYTIATVTPGTYTVSSVSDNNCSGSATGQAVITNYETPTATLGGDPNVCEGSGDGPELTLTGNGPWTVEYTFQGVPQEPITTSFPNYVIPADQDGLFELVSVSDQNCDGTVSGSLQVTIIDAPTATLTGGGTVCEGSEVPFTVNVTGDGPWTVQYAVDGVPQPPLNIDESSSSHTFQSGLGGNYTLLGVTDENCAGQTMTSQASLVVNPIPSVDIQTNEDDICIGEQLDLTFDLQGNPPFDLTYVLNGDTVTVSGLGTSYFQSLTPTEPVNVEVISIVDGSTPTCMTNSSNSRFIPVGELPDAPQLVNDTICTDDGSVQIGVEAVPGLSYSWYPTNRLSDPNVSNPVFEAHGFFPDAKNFQYILTASDGDCVAQDTMIIRVDPGPRARFEYSPNPVRSEDTKVHFQNMTPGNGEMLYFWEFDSLSTSQALNPTYEFPSGVVADYRVTLTVIDPATGCRADFTDVVAIRPQMLVYVPNAFTPNGDGLNDLWGPVMTHIDDKDYRLTVYNRFGEIVFSTKDPDQKWNGGMNGGTYYVESGVYLWVIETKNPITLDEFDFKGKVTVIR